MGVFAAAEMCSAHSRANKWNHPKIALPGAHKGRRSPRPEKGFVEEHLVLNQNSPSVLQKVFSLVRSHRCSEHEKIAPGKHMGEGDGSSFIARLNGTQEKISRAGRQLNCILVHDQNISDCYFYHRAQIWIIFSGLDLTKCLINNTLTYFNLLELCIIL